MSTRSLNLSDELYDYMLDVSLREPDVMTRLRRETAAHPLALMQISPEQGQFMALLVELIGARRILEVGTFTGYSSLAMARALPDDGQLVACDISEDFTAIARRHWDEAGVAHKISLNIGPALETLERLIAEGHDGSFDLAFVDADKENQPAYAEHAHNLLRPGGLLLVDNVLWSGKVADPAKQDDDTEAIRALNAQLHGDHRWSLSMLPLGDGLTLARKR